MLEVIERALAEDVGEGDVTTMAVVPAGARAHARIEQKAGASRPAAGGGAVFARVGPDLRWHAHAAEGVWGDRGLWRRSRATPARSSLPSGWR